MYFKATIEFQYWLSEKDILDNYDSTKPEDVAWCDSENFKDLPHTIIETLKTCKIHNFVVKVEPVDDSKH